MQIRLVTEGDISALGYIHLTCLRAAYDGAVDADYLAGLTAEEFQEKWVRWLTEDDHQTHGAVMDDGTLVGYVSFGKLRTPIPGQSPIRPLYSSEIYVIYILPDYWQQGIATKLIKHAVSELQKQKHRSLCLWVVDKNKRAISFYKKLGGERCGKKDIEIGPSQCREVAFGWRDISLIGK